MRLMTIAIVFLLGLAGPVAAQAYALLHGNYCGYKRIVGPDGSELPPVDLLDAICMRHDKCYDLLGNASCSCDLELMQEVSERSWAKGRSVNLARVVFYGIAAKPCSDLEGQLIKIQIARSTDM